MSGLPREARDGIMRAWLEILRQRHPNVTWIAAQEDELREDETPSETEPELVLTA
jgi:hypothetical protein